MSRDGNRKVVEALLDRHGRTFSGELGIDLARNTPSPLFQWLVASTLLAARIRTEAAMRAAETLFGIGWKTPDRMADSTWRQRTDALNRAGYARYDESTARMLGETTDLVVARYGGDLRNLREAADFDPEAERALLKEFKGIGDVGADIFCREVQTVWDEHYPFADERALRAARALGLGENARDLAGQVERGDFPRLVAALVRADLAGDLDDLRNAA